MIVNYRNREVDRTERTFRFILNGLRVKVGGIWEMTTNVGITGSFVKKIVNDLKFDNFVSLIER